MENEKSKIAVGYEEAVKEFLERKGLTKRQVLEVSKYHIDVLKDIERQLPQWIDVKDKLPEFDVNVLIYWKLEKGKKEGGYYDMIEIASVKSVTTGKDYKSAEWVGSDYNGKSPTHWMPLPSIPKTK